MKKNSSPLCLALILLLIWATTLTLPLYAQSKSTVTVTGKAITLKDFLSQIEQQTHLKLVCDRTLTFSHPRSMHYRNAPLDKVLKEILPSEHIRYLRAGNCLILTPAQSASSPSASSKKSTISGYITDQSSAETLIGAAVQSPSLGLGAVTNPYGYYTLSLPSENRYLLIYSSLGYATEVRDLYLKNDTTLNISLRSTTQLQEVLVSGERSDAFHTPNIGVNDIPMAQIRHTPSILGEADVLKTVQLMPGVQTGMQGFSGIYVRGGGRDENLVLLDGIPVYNVNHLLGIFSIFTPEAVKKVSLYKSSFPSEFSGRTSSVLDIRTNNGDMKKYHGSISIGLISDKIHVEGPIVKDKTSFHLSGRLTHTLFFGDGISTGDDDKTNIYFYDLNAKLNHKFNDRNRLFIHLFHGNDTWKNRYNDEYSSTSEVETNRIIWGNTLAAVGLNHIFTPQLYNNTTVAFNRYKAFMEYSVEETTLDREKHQSYNKYRSGLNDFSVRSNFTYIPNNSHHATFGISYIRHSFTPEEYTLKTEAEQSLRDTVYSIKPRQRTLGNEFSLYGEDKIDLTKKWSLSAGFNFTHFSTSGKSYNSFEPRLSTVFNLSSHCSVKAGYSRMSQYLHLLSTSKLSLPTDIWVPVTEKVRPMKSDLYSTGAYYDTHRGWKYSLEGYYKNTDNLLDYLDGASMLGNSAHWEEMVAMGKGRSYGVEMMIQKTEGRATGWVSYTLAKSERKFDDMSINSGKWYPSAYDHRHHLNICLNYQLTKGIEMGATWSFLSGGTISVPVSQMNLVTPEGQIVKADYYVSKNNYRVPPTHLLNLSVNFNRKTRHGIRTWNISLYNAYNAMNPSLINFKRKENGERVLHRLTILPCIPSVSYTYRF